jgi:hypothetical protein
MMRWSGQPGGRFVRYRATSRWQRIFVTTLWGFFFFLETGAYFDRNGTQPGELAFTSGFLAVLAWLGVRSSRMATLLADEDKVVVRAQLRTRSWSWDQIDAFVVETRLVGGFVKYRRRMLGIRQHDGRLRWLTELNCRPAKGRRGAGRLARKARYPGRLDVQSSPGARFSGCSSRGSRSGIVRRGQNLSKAPAASLRANS